MVEKSKKQKKPISVKKKQKKSKQIGIIILLIQLFVSLMLLWAVVNLGVLPNYLLICLTAFLTIVWVALFVNQIRFKKGNKVCKIISLFLTVIFIVGTFFIMSASATLLGLTGDNYKIETIVVAVRIDDPADSIKDAKDYSFGVQYTLGESNTLETIENIEDTVGQSIDIVELESISEQATSLLDEEVDAIIYNQAYTDMIDDEIDDYSEKVKIIYEYQIITEINDNTNDIDVTSEHFSVYISGIDVSGSISNTSRSDVNILAVVDPVEQTVLLVNTPRDYWVYLPDVSGDVRDKLTHAGIYGIDESIKTLEYLYETDIEFYIRVNFTSVETIVDALGGVDVYSEFTFTTSQATGTVVNIEEGLNTLDGAQALAFARERKSLPGGDNDRGKNQQALITGLIDKIASPSVITSFSGILSSVSGNIDTNMTQSQIQSLIKYQIGKGMGWEVESMSATGTGSTEYCYSSYGNASVIIPDDESVQSIIDAIKLARGETVEETTDETDET